MRKKLAELLIRLAELISPTIVPEEMACSVPKKLGLTILIDRKDIRKFRKANKEIRSFRQAKRECIKDTINKIGMSISATIAKRRLINFHVDEKAHSVIVSGYIGIYVSKNKVKEIGVG